MGPSLSSQKRVAVAHVAADPINDLSQLRTWEVKVPGFGGNNSYFLVVQCIL